MKAWFMSLWTFKNFGKRALKFFGESGNIEGFKTNIFLKNIFLHCKSLRKMPTLRNAGVFRDQLSKIWFTCSLTIVILVLYSTVWIFHNSCTIQKMAMLETYGNAQSYVYLMALSCRVMLCVANLQREREQIYYETTATAESKALWISRDAGNL